jgi:VanZ family protein
MKVQILMSSNSTRPAPRLTLLVPVIFLVLAATAMPIELRPLGEVPMSFEFHDVGDIVENIVGYLPVGIVLGGLGLLKAVFIAGLLSTFAETSQLVMMHRDPAFTDIVSNLAGATLGTLASARWRMRSPALQIDRWKAVLAVVLAFALVLYVWSMAGDPVNTRGATSPGTLEAHWKLDESGGRAALDASGHALVGKFRKAPIRTSGAMGSAPVFDGTNYVNFGRSTALRLAGSMTISAWINSSSYPVDDAAIVSQLRVDRGYQLDTTVDEGPRTIGFKLSNAHGQLMARYGTTPLTLDTWYHVAGVYDAAAQTLDVYLNGEVDNGVLLGAVSNVQRSSRGAVYIGRRGNSTQFNFSGSIANVRIYSFALTKSQIAADMRGEAVQAPATVRADGGPPCAPWSDREDKELPLMAAVLGLLVTVACLGVWPSATRLPMLAMSVAVGVLLLTVTAPNLPAFDTWMLPLAALAGGASIMVGCVHALSRSCPT